MSALLTLVINMILRDAGLMLVVDILDHILRTEQQNQTWTKLFESLVIKNMSIKRRTTNFSIADVGYRKIKNTVMETSYCANFNKKCNIHIFRNLFNLDFIIIKHRFYQQILYLQIP